MCAPCAAILRVKARAGAELLEDRSLGAEDRFAAPNLLLTRVWASLGIHPVTERDSLSHQRSERSWRWQGFLIQGSRDGASGLAHVCTLPKYHYPPCYCWCESAFMPEVAQPVQLEFRGGTSPVPARAAGSARLTRDSTLAGHQPQQARHAAS